MSGPDNLFVNYMSRIHREEVWPDNNVTKQILTENQRAVTAFMHVHAHSAGPPVHPDFTQNGTETLDQHHLVQAVWNGYSCILILCRILRLSWKAWHDCYRTRWSRPICRDQPRKFSSTRRCWFCSGGCATLTRYCRFRALISQDKKHSQLFLKTLLKIHSTTWKKNLHCCFKLFGLVASHNWLPTLYQWQEIWNTPRGPHKSGCLNCKIVATQLRNF